MKAEATSICLTWGQEKITYIDFHSVVKTIHIENWKAEMCARGLSETSQGMHWEEGRTSGRPCQNVLSLLSMLKCLWCLSLKDIYQVDHQCLESQPKDRQTRHGHDLHVYIIIIAI